MWKKVIGITLGTSIAIIAASGPINVTQTTGPVVLYVDGISGNDSNACTTNDAGACATITGALAKLTTRVLADNVTINVAGNSLDAGVFEYTETPAIVGFSVTSRDGGWYHSLSNTGPRLLIAGTAPANWPQAYVDAGTATGTLSSVTAASAGNAYTLNDTTQSWHDGGLAGLYVVMTSGAGSGNAMPIIDNTTNSLRLVTSVTAAAADTYKIATPAALVKTGVSTQPFRIRGNTAPIILQDIGVHEFNSWPIINDNSDVNLTRFYLKNDVSAAPSLAVSDVRTFTLSRVSFDSIRSGVFTTSGTIQNMSLFGVLANGPNATAATVNYGHSGTGNCLDIVAATTSTTGTAIQFSTSNNGTLNCSGTPRVICPSGNAGNAGIAVSGATGNLVSPGHVTLSLFGMTSEGCAVGLSLGGSGASMTAADRTSTYLMIGAVNAFSIGKGARAYLTAGNTFTFTSVTNQLSIDGVAKGYAADLTGNGAISNTPYLSAFYE